MAKARVSLADMQEEFIAVEQDAPTLTVVEDGPAPTQRASQSAKATTPAPDKSFKRVGLYLHPAVKREIDTIAFTHEQKSHDLYLEAIDLLLKRYGRSSIKQLETK